MTSYRRKSWRAEMTVRVDVNGVLATLVGDEGLTVQDLEALAPRIAEVHESLESSRREPAFPRLAGDKKGIRELLDLAREVRGESDTLVVLGIGGSALGARALYSALCPPFHSWRPGSPDGARLIIADSVDPRTFGAVLDEVDPYRTTFNVISKSGETAETMSQFLVVRDRLLKVLGAVDYTQRVVITTDAMTGALRQIVNDEGFRSLPIPAGIGGHFSVLSAVALFPAAVAGLDIHALLAGAENMEERCRVASPFQNPAYLHAAVHYLAQTRRQKNVQVIMPYSDALLGLALWLSQLWAESLGKDRGLDGTPFASGQTVVTAVGAADQHSQLQLFVAGPNDKVVTFVRVEDHGFRLEVPSGYADLEGVGYLGGRTLGELLNLEQRATEALLAQRGRLSTTIHVPAVNAYTMGQLVRLLEVQVLAAAALHRVDPFDQPGIEEGKKLTYAMAGRKGLEETRAQVQASAQRKNPHFIV
jgi:glucose-6-phosphate isomerase